MTERTLDILRGRDFVLAGLPETIHVPALGQRHEAVTKPIEAATVDDLAFAQIALHETVSTVHRQLEALRRVSDLARRNGAVGADNAVLSLPPKEAM